METCNASQATFFQVFTAVNANTAHDEWWFIVFYVYKPVMKGSKTDFYIQNVTDTYIKVYFAWHQLLVFGFPSTGLQDCMVCCLSADV